MNVSCSMMDSMNSRSSDGIHELLLFDGHCELLLSYGLNELLMDSLNVCSLNPVERSVLFDLLVPDSLADCC